jgi:hypothetical protein
MPVSLHRVRTRVAAVSIGNLIAGATAVATAQPAHAENTIERIVTCLLQPRTPPTPFAHRHRQSVAERCSELGSRRPSDAAESNKLAVDRLSGYSNRFKDNA